MFRRRWSGLPKDAEFQSNLKDLGYFVNEDDEIRNIEDPNYYFKYHLTKNTRVNDRQRFHFNEAIRDIVHGRLEKEGLLKVPLPLGTPTSSPNVPIFTSANLASASRVVVIFGEPTQDLGNMALRVANGPGGINKGTMVSVVQDIKRQASSAADPSPPGIILANAGELWWWPERNKGLNLTSAASVPMKSMVHYGRADNAKIHRIPKNEGPEGHIAHVLNDVLCALVSKEARLDIIAIGLSSDVVTKALDNPETWTTLGHRINTLSLLGSSTDISELSHGPFKDFLPRRARAYIADDAAALTPLAKPGGNPNTASFTEQGCTVFASGEPYYIELILITSRVPILAWLEEVARAGPGYRHPEVVPVDPPVPTEEEWAAMGLDAVWDKVPESARPGLSYAGSHEVKGQDKGSEDVQPDMADQLEKQGAKDTH